MSPVLSHHATVTVHRAGALRCRRQPLPMRPAAPPQPATFFTSCTPIMLWFCSILHGLLMPTELDGMEWKETA